MQRPAHPVRYFALTLGIVFLIVGVAGFIPGLTTQHAGAPELAVHGPGHGYLLGLFHVNLLHNLVHLAFGVWGVIAYRSYDASRLYARGVAVIYGVLVVFGLCPDPRINTLFGLVPVHGHDVWLHAVLALAGAVFGWAPLGAVDRPPPATATHVG